MKKSKKKKAPKAGWYELVAHFDAHKIKAIPVEGRAFLMGAVSGINVVEVSRDTPDEQLAQLASWLDAQGIEAIVVSEGVRFMKLKPATPEENEVLEAHLKGELENGAAVSDSAGD